MASLPVGRARGVLCGQVVREIVKEREMCVYFMRETTLGLFLFVLSDALPCSSWFDCLLYLFVFASGRSVSEATVRPIVYLVSEGPTVCRLES